MHMKTSRNILFNNHFRKQLYFFNLAASFQVILRRTAMKKLLFLFITTTLVFNTIISFSQEYYWIGFNNKHNTRHSLSTPGAFLSERAIQRRIKQHIPIDSLDLPVNVNYISEVLKVGAKYVHSSKWLNGLTVQAESDSFRYKVAKLPFVKEVQQTKNKIVKGAFDKFNEAKTFESARYDSSYYGPSIHQVSTLNGLFLHNQNYRGQGMHIAVIDAGFSFANSYSAFDSIWANKQILGTRDFVNPAANIFGSHSHGMSVLSCMAGNVPGKLVGTAPKSNYWLLRSEDTGSEFLIEEDNWVVAAEFADSAGVDIINSSLGYYTFDDPKMNHTFKDMDGNTTRVTRGANIAASKGMLVFASAGNEGNSPWKYIIAPSDGINVFGVGAVNKEGNPAYFTSYGPAYGGKVKPNAVAVGLNTYLQKENSALGYANGTSFSSPVLAGMAACLWQAFPFSSAKQVKLAIEMSGSLYEKPDSLRGFGIPDMKKAYSLLSKLSVPKQQITKTWTVYPNPVGDMLFILNNGNSRQGEIKIEIFSIDGKLLRSCIKNNGQRIEINDMDSLPNGILLLKISTSVATETIKLSKKS